MSYRLSASVSHTGMFGPKTQQLLQRYPLNTEVSTNRTLGSELVAALAALLNDALTQGALIQNCLTYIESALQSIEQPINDYTTTESIKGLARRCLTVAPLLDVLKATRIPEGVNPVVIHDLQGLMFQAIVEPTATITEEGLTNTFHSITLIFRFSEALPNNLYGRIVSSRQDFERFSTVVGQHEETFELLTEVIRDLPVVKQGISNRVEIILNGHANELIQFEDADKAEQTLAGLRLFVRRFNTEWPQQEYDGLYNALHRTDDNNFFDLMCCLPLVFERFAHLNNQQAIDEIKLEVSSAVVSNQLTSLEVFLKTPREELLEEVHPGDLDLADTIHDKSLLQQQRHLLRRYQIAFDRARNRHSKTLVSQRGLFKCWDDVVPGQSYHRREILVSTRSSIPGHMNYSLSAHIFAALVDDTMLARASERVLTLARQNHSILNVAEADLRRLRASRSNTARTKLDDFFGYLNRGMPQAAIQRLFEHRNSRPHWHKISKGGMRFMQHFNGEMVPLVAIEALMEFIIRDLLHQRDDRSHDRSNICVENLLKNSNKNQHLLRRADAIRVSKAQAIYTAFGRMKAINDVDENGCVNVREFYGNRNDPRSLAHAYQRHQSTWLTRRNTASTKLNLKFFPSLNQPIDNDEQELKTLAEGDPVLIR